jgi:hypothetical protein
MERNMKYQIYYDPEVCLWGVMENGHLFKFFSKKGNAIKFAAKMNKDQLDKLFTSKERA